MLTWSALFDTHFLCARMLCSCVQVQGKDPSVDITQELIDESEEERFDDMSSPGLELPPCELSRLEEMAELVASSLPSPLRREKLALALENEGYIRKLLELFRQCEAQGNREALHQLYDVVKGIFLLNRTALFEVGLCHITLFVTCSMVPYCIVRDNL